MPPLRCSPAWRRSGSRRVGGDRARVGDRVDVAERRQDRGAQAELGEPDALDHARRGLAHRHAPERRRIGAAQADAPVAAVERGAEHGVGAVERAEPCVEQLRGDLRRVHPDEERRAADILERGGETRRQPVSALGHDLEAARHPCAGRSVQHEHPPSRAARERDGCERVAECGTGQVRRLLRAAGRHQARLHPAGCRALRDHDERGPGHPSTAAMSRTARRVPRTVPVTFDRPRRGSSRTATSSIAQPAAAARMTISSGHPNRRSRMPSPSSASRPAARIGPRSVRRTPVAPAQLERERAVRDPAVQRAAATAGAEHEVGGAATHRLRDERQLTRVERRVAVHEADDVTPRGPQPGEARGAEAGLRLEHHARAERGGELARAVGRPVVDHDRLVAGRHALQHPRQRLTLVQDRKDHVHNGTPIPATHPARLRTTDVRAGGFSAVRRIRRRRWCAQTRMRLRFPSTFAAVALLALTAGACGSDDEGAAGDSAAAPQPVAQIDALTGRTTAVTLDAGFVSALESLEVTPGPVGDATISKQGVASFPITGGNVTYYEPGTVSPFVQGELDHDGAGLSLTAGGKRVELTDFVIDPGASVLTGTVSVDGAVAAEDAPLFFLDGRTLNPLEVNESNGTAILEGTTVKLKAEAADLLNETFGIQDLEEGLVIGVATITIDTAG